MAKKKSVRVNLSTTPQEIIASLREELPSVAYQFRKPYGGNRKYLKFEDELLDKALAEEKQQITDMNEYISRAGNRWISYTMVDYYPKAKYAKPTFISFIYYETYGSCGAFFPLFSSHESRKNNPDGVLIFTSHFFLRMSERTGKAYRSKELIQEFIATKNTKAAQADEDGEVIVKFKGGYGFGVEKSKSPRVLEVRTYLTDGQLSSKQRRKVEKLDAYYDLIGEGMHMKEVALMRAYHSEDNIEQMERDAKRKLQNLKKIGLDKQAKLQIGIHVTFSYLIEDILHMKLSMAQSTYICQLEMECGMIEMLGKYADIDWRHTDDVDGINAQFESDMIDLFCKVANKMNLKSVNRETLTRRYKELVNSNIEKN